MKHKEILQYLVNEYSKAVDESKDLDGYDYKDFVKHKNISYGACFLLVTNFNHEIAYKACNSYWMKRNLNGNTYLGNIYLCDTGYNGREFLIKRLEIFQRELDKINKYGWLAKFF